jgi:hypothetical protein
MVIFVLLISLIILAFGTVGLVFPARLVNMVRWFDNLRGLYIAAVFRLAFGLSLIDIASISRWPNFFYALGGLTVVAGAGLLLLGEQRFHRIAEWWCGQSEIFLRAWCLLALVLGGCLIYSLSLSA